MTEATTDGGWKRTEVDQRWGLREMTLRVRDDCDRFSPQIKRRRKIFLLSLRFSNLRLTTRIHLPFLSNEHDLKRGSQRVLTKINHVKSMDMMASSTILKRIFLAF